MKYILIFCFLLNLFSPIWSQSERTIQIVSNGQGTTMEEAVIVCKKQAIENIFNGFVSSNKEFLKSETTFHDLLNEMSGIITQFVKISEVLAANAVINVSANITISITKIKDYYEKQGNPAEFDGGIFSDKIKKQKMLEEIEYNAVKKLCQVGFDILQKAPEFSISYKDPILIAGSYSDEAPSPYSTIGDYKFNEEYGYYYKEYSANDFKIDFTVKVKYNDNYEIFLNMLIKTIQSLALSAEEIVDYRGVNKRLVPIKIDEKFYYLRNLDVVKILSNFLIRANTIPFAFIINGGGFETNFLLKNRYLRQNTEQKSFINIKSVGYYGSYTHKKYDFLSELSNTILKSSNQLPFFVDMFKDYNSFEKEKLVHIYLPPYNFNDGLTIDGFPEVNSDIEKVNSDPDSYIYVNSTEIPEHSLAFIEYFTLEEIEKIKSINVQRCDMLQVLRKERDRLEQMKFVEMDRGLYDGVYYDLKGNKFEYNQDLFNGKKIVALIEYKKDYSLVKVYDTKTSKGDIRKFQSLNNRPAMLYYVPNNKILKKMKFNELPSDIKYQYN